VTADRALGDFIAQRYPRLRQTRHAGARIKRSTYDHGAADGKNIVLRKGVSQTDGNLGRLLSRE